MSLKMKTAKYFKTHKYFSKYTFKSDKLIRKTETRSSQSFQAASVRLN